MKQPKAIILTSSLPRELLERAYREIEANREIAEAKKKVKRKSAG